MPSTAFDTNPEEVLPALDRLYEIRNAFEALKQSIPHYKNQMFQADVEPQNSSVAEQNREHIYQDYGIKELYELLDMGDIGIIASLDQYIENLTKVLEAIGILDTDLMIDDPNNPNGPGGVDPNDPNPTNGSGVNTEFNNGFYNNGAPIPTNNSEQFNGEFNNGFYNNGAPIPTNNSEQFNGEFNNGFYNNGAPIPTNNGEHFNKQFNNEQIGLNGNKYVYPNGVPRNNYIYPNGVPRNNYIYPNGVPRNNYVYPNGVPINNYVYPNGVPRNNYVYPNGVPINNYVYPNGVPRNNYVYPNGVPRNNYVYPNGVPRNNYVYPNGVPRNNYVYPNGVPRNNYVYPNGVPINNYVYPNTPGVNTVIITNTIERNSSPGPTPLDNRSTRNSQIITNRIGLNTSRPIITGNSHGGGFTDPYSGGGGSGGLGSLNEGISTSIEGGSSKDKGKDKSKMSSSILDILSKGASRLAKGVTPGSGSSSEGGVNVAALAGAGAAAAGAAIGGGILLAKKFGYYTFTPDDWAETDEETQQIILNDMAKIGFTPEEMDLFQTSTFKIAHEELDEHVKKIEDAYMVDEAFETNLNDQYGFTVFDESDKVVKYYVFIIMILDGKNSIDEYNMYNIINQSLAETEESDFTYFGINMEDYIDDGEEVVEEEYEVSENSETQNTDETGNSTDAFDSSWLKDVGINE